MVHNNVVEHIIVDNVMYVYMGMIIIVLGLLSVLGRVIYIGFISLLL